MKPIFEKMIGTTKSWLTIKSYERCPETGRVIWVAECKCGNVIRMRESCRRQNKSCGCFRKSGLVDWNSKTKTHGESKSFLYVKWKGIKNRCFNKNCKEYRLYGGRGISVFSGWIDDFVAFRDYMNKSLGNKPVGRYSLDRIDNDKGYEPGNLRWADHKTQTRNRSMVPMFEAFGAKRSVAEWSEITGIKAETIRARIKNGWAIDIAVSHPPVSDRKRPLPTLPVTAVSVD